MELFNFIHVFLTIVRQLIFFFFLHLMPWHRKRGLDGYFHYGLISLLTTAQNFMKLDIHVVHHKPQTMFCELINAEYFMKTLNITSMFVSRMPVAAKLLKMCLSNILIEDEIFKR